MRVLVACEESDVVGSAFRALGHDVTSCDLLPSQGSPKHIQGDVRPLLRMPWDLVIAHPPCQKLSTARGSIDWEGVGQAIAFFLECQHANAERVAVENPTQFKYVRQFTGEPDCIVQPWQFGDAYVKRTCWWLQGLPPLMPQLVGTDMELPLLVQSSGANYKRGRKGHGGHRSPKLRARFHPGMAAAMAKQWGN